MRRVTSRHLLDAIKLAAGDPGRHARTALAECSRDLRSWRELYAGTEDVVVFRDWLKREPDNSHVLALKYARMQIPPFCGYMSYRYLQLCCRNQARLYEPGQIARFEDIAAFERESCYIDQFIRQESLEDDLCSVLESIRPLSESERSGVYASDKTKVSRRSHLLEAYYDPESVELVRDRERLLIEKFGYSAPVLN